MLRTRSRNLTPRRVQQRAMRERRVARCRRAMSPKATSDTWTGDRDPGEHRHEQAGIRPAAGVSAPPSAAVGASIRGRHGACRRTLISWPWWRKMGQFATFRDLWFGPMCMPMHLSFMAMVAKNVSICDVPRPMDRANVHADAPWFHGHDGEKSVNLF